MLRYREILPPARLADDVECLWTMRHDGVVPRRHRVPPDGCADLVFSRDGERTALLAVGTMTTFADFAIAPGRWMVGVRFRPGRSAGVFGCPATALTDGTVPVEDLWGSRAHALEARLGCAGSLGDAATAFAQALTPGPARSPVGRAIEALERQGGQVPLDELSLATGLSSRQFRRRCVQETGLSPKFLARILRFRRASVLAGRCRGDHAGLAYDCGYVDQAHMIAEFREFCGRTPARFGSSGV